MTANLVETKAMSKAYAVLYDSADHWSILTQSWGSLWPKVFPFCLLNFVIMIILSELRTRYNIDGSITNQGHTFVGVIVAFLLVSRVNIALARFNECRGYLSLMYQESRQLITNMAALSSTGACENNNDISSQQWRNEVAYRMLVVLRTSMAVVDYPTSRVPADSVTELSGMELEDVKQRTYQNTDYTKWAYEVRSEFEHTMRVPLRLAFLLKKSLNEHATRLKEPLNVAQANGLIACVDNFLKGYYGLRKFLTTPVPFPLIQMSRTFLFAYVFTIPFALLSDSSIYWAHWIQVFILTYGFAGLELVAIEMDNPFGDGEIDFDNAALARVCMEDAFLIINDVDGEVWTEKLRNRMGADKVSEEIATEATGLLR